MSSSSPGFYAVFTDPIPIPNRPNPNSRDAQPGARLLLAQLQRGAVDLDHRRVDAVGAAGPDACFAQPGGEPWRVVKWGVTAAPETKMM